MRCRTCNGPGGASGDSYDGECENCADITDMVSEEFAVIKSFRTEAEARAFAACFEWINLSTVEFIGVYAPRHHPANEPLWFALFHDFDKV